MTDSDIPGMTLVRLTMEARFLCPNWMVPIYNSHYLAVQRKLIEAYRMGRNEEKEAHSEKKS